MSTTNYLAKYMATALANAAQPTRFRVDCNIAQRNLTSPCTILVFHGVDEDLPIGLAELLTEKVKHFNPSQISALGIPAITIIPHKGVIGFIEKRAMAKIRQSC